MRLKKVLLFTAISLFILSSCKENSKQTPATQNTIGKIELLDDEAKLLLNVDAPIEVLDSGFVWTEGPLWLESDSSLLFSDVPSNKIYKWKEGQKTQTYLEPSGYTGANFEGKEPGSNGLMLNNEGKLAMAQHGNHQIAYMDALLGNPETNFVTLANQYEGKRLNSPNDLIQDKAGNYYFTDPVYGLAKPDDQELSFTGVYKLSKDGELKVLVDSIIAPNGIAFTNDEKTLLVANSDTDKAYLYAFDLSDDGNSVTSGKIVYDFTPQIKNKGDVPDGFKVDRKGNIYISGPQGLWILNKAYKPIAKLQLPHAISNCWLADNDKTLYITGTDKVLRLKLK